jgi:rsbT antagonist protein RsbS
MSIPGLHLTRIGDGDFLLEPSRSLNIRDQDSLIDGIVAHLLQARGARLYYDLAEQAIIDPVYYAWLNRLARAVWSVNVKMVCIHMQPTAAFALVQFPHEPQAFETAMDILGWQ